MNKTVAYVPHN